MEKDEKGVYKEHIGKTEVIGVDIEFDRPQNPDLILNTSNETEEESFNKLVQFLEERMRG